jgi:formylglycine-generating enzyme required for sulfatase activity
MGSIAPLSNFMAQISIAKHSQKIHYFEEPLHRSNLILNPLNMVLIQGGDFYMGSPETEIDRSQNESPQHFVTVPSFFMSEFPIARAHWFVVADTMPQVDIPLEKFPSTLKPNDDRTVHPITDVNWFEAVEFCKRLSKHSGRTYRLPTEAEWEYACRAGTTTPFHFGETITTDLANYNGTNHNNYDDDDNCDDYEWSGAYERGPEGIYREETTPVATFLPNEFGLYDMHGNVWEWCLDYWLGNYQGVPTDVNKLIKEDKAKRMLRGGSWDFSPHICRSATRINHTPDYRNDDIGFRVVCEIPMTF